MVRPGGASRGGYSPSGLLGDLARAPPQSTALVLAERLRCLSTYAFVSSVLHHKQPLIVTIRKSNWAVLSTKKRLCLPPALDISFEDRLLTHHITPNARLFLAKKSISFMSHTRLLAESSGTRSLPSSCTRKGSTKDRR